MSDYDNIRNALTYIDPNDRETWLRIGAAVKDELGEDGFEMWDNWSRQSSNYKEADAKSVWKSLKQGHIHIGTLFYHARANGYRPEKPYTPPSAEELAKRAQEAQAKQRAEAERIAQAHAKAEKTAYGIWKNASPADPSHAYAQNKGLNEAAMSGIRQNEYNGKKQLIIPLYSDKKLVNVQTIDEDGNKSFLSGGQKQGAYTIIGDLKQNQNGIVLAEGFATAASVHQATGKPVIVAFDAGNLRAVSEKLIDVLPKDVPVYFAADNDPSHTGEHKAQAAAEVWGKRAKIMLPEFTPTQIQQYQQEKGVDKVPTDFNDLHKLAGIEAVRETLSEIAKPEIKQPEPEIKPSAPMQEYNKPELSQAELMKNNYWRVQNGYDPLPEMPNPELQQDFKQPENISIDEMWHKAERSDWGDFPPLVRNGNLEEMKTTDGYREAKAGDPQAALNLVQSLLSEQTVDDIKKMANGREPIIVGIRAEESKGKNQIPTMMVHVLSQQTGWEKDENLYQISYAGRTGSDSSYRLAFPAVFGGEVKAGRDYLILDDNSTMGGTIAGLKGYIENRGGKVIGAAVMSARATGLELVPTEKQLNDIQRKHGDAANDFFQKTYGYGIRRLTRSEAGAVRTSPTIDELRNRINEARISAQQSMGRSRIETQPTEIESAQRNTTERVTEKEVYYEQPNQTQSSKTQSLRTEAPPRKEVNPSTQTATSKKDVAVSIEEQETTMSSNTPKTESTPFNGIEYDSLRHEKEQPEQQPEPITEPVTTAKQTANKSTLQSPDLNEPELPHHKTLERQQPVLDLAYERPPKNLQSRYVVADNGQYLSADNHTTVLFEDKGNALKTAKSDNQTIQDMLEVAKAKGWDSIKISGSPEFKSMMYVAAESQGIKTTGYKPTPADLAMVEKLREERSLNGIQSTYKPELDPTKQPENQQSEKPDVAALSAADKLKTQSAVPDERQINSSPIADTEAAPKVDSLGNKTIPSEVLRSSQEMTTTALSPEVATAKSTYDQKSQQLSEPNQARLKAYERNTMDALRDVQGDARNHALRNYYEYTTKAMNGTELNLPQPMQNRAPTHHQAHEPQQSNSQDFEMER